MVLSRFTNGKHKGWIEPSLRLPEGLLEDPASAADLDGAETLLDCRGRKIYRVLLERAGRRAPCFVYLFQNSSLNRSLRRSYAAHILRMSQLLHEAGFDTLEVLAAFRPKWQFLNWSSFLVAAEIESVQELPSTGRHVYQLHSWADFTRAIASAVATSLAELHERGFVHGDLKTRHILTRRNGGSSPPQVLFVDLEKTKRLPSGLSRLHDFFAARDLIQLLASLPTEMDGHTMEPKRDHFVDEYFRARRISPFRRRVISRLLRLYEPGGGLRQGETVFGCLTSSLLHRVAGRDRRGEFEPLPRGTGPSRRDRIWDVRPGVVGGVSKSEAEGRLEE